MRVLEVQVASQSMLADSARALVWPEQRAMLIADLHLGKADVFRQAGLAMPDGNDASDLCRLSELVVRHSIERLFLLGDIVHGATTQAASWRGAWQEFTAAYPGLEITAIVGNHDRHDHCALHATAATVTEYQLGPLLLRHHPVATDRISLRNDPGFVIAGHLHPLVVVADGARKFRLPCFWLQEAQLILPAFGSTTRGQPVVAADRERVIAITPAGLLEVSSDRSDHSSMKRVSGIRKN